MEPAPPVPADEQRAEWLRRWQEQHDVDALDALLRAEIDDLARGLRARGGTPDAALSASDLVQEAVLRWLRLEQPPRFEDVRALRGYLWSAAWRLLVNRARSVRDVVRLSPDETSSLSGAIAVTGGIGALAADEQRTALEVVVNLLRPEDRECVGLVYLQGLPIAEAAARAGISRGAFDMRLMRARQRLAERLADWADIVG